MYDGSTLATQVNAKLNLAGTWTNGATPLVWNCSYSAITGKFTWAYGTANPSGASDLIIKFIPTGSNTIKLFGSIADQITVSGTAVAPNVARSFIMPAPIDLAPFQSIRVHSNVAKRTFAMVGNGRKVLTGTNILFEIPVYNQLVGGTMSFVPQDASLYRQEIMSNFDNMSFELRAPNGNLIPLFSGAECNFTFVIEREIFQPTNEDRIQSQNDYLSFSRM